MGCASVPIMFTDVIPPSYAFVAPDESERPTVALVLGGGAARGFAHVGVIKALEANGISPDLVVGTSAGSFVGALYAGGYGGEKLEKLALALEQEQLRDFIFPDLGFVKGLLLQDRINQALDNKSIEELDKRFAAVATHLQTGDLAVFNRGNTGMAVRASSSVPGVFQPVHILGRDYVDGGLISPVPVHVAKDLGADIIIAVDVSTKPEQTVAIDNIFDVLMQSVAIMGQTASLLEMSDAHVIIRPNLSEIGITDFTSKENAIEAGEAITQKAIPAILKLIGQRVEAQAPAVFEG